MINKKEIIIIFILIIIAFIRFFFFIPEPPLYTKAIDMMVEVEGVVDDIPDVRLYNQQIILKPTDQKINILLIVSNDIEISYGDKIKVKGILKEPDNFLTESGKEFNYKRYLANQDIYFIIKNPEIEIISKGNANYLKLILFKIRSSFSKNINKVISAPESSLSNGLILGERGGFDSETKQEFIRTGTIHIVALSGYNITIVSEGVMKVFSLIFSQTLSIIFGLIVIILFIIMSGASATAIRAGIMATIMLFGRMTGRIYDAGRALVITALLMITYDPRVVLNISFQLSFLATFGVLFITPKVISWVYFLPIRFKIREITATTIAATMSVLPLLMYSTGVLSLVSLPANILILPLIPPTMLFSFLTGLLGYISPFLTLPFAYVSHLLLFYMLSVIHFFASLPFASLNITNFPIIITLFLYVILIYWVFKKDNK